LIDLLKDDTGVRSSGDLLLSRNFDLTGIFTCQHRTAGSVTVINYANQFELNGNGRIAAEHTRIANANQGFTLDFLEDDYIYHAPSEITPGLDTPPVVTPEIPEMMFLDTEDVLDMDFFPTHESSYSEDVVTFSDAEHEI
jgi:hypothetical protein